MTQPKALGIINEVRKTIIGKDTVVCKTLMAIIGEGISFWRTTQAWARPLWPWLFPGP